VAARFSARINTGPGPIPGHPWGKQPGVGLNHPPPLTPRVKERVELYLYSHPVPSWQVIGCTFLGLIFMLHCTVAIIRQPANIKCTTVLDMQ